MSFRRCLPLLLFFLAAVPAAAVELRLVREATVTGDVVRLGMVAEIRGAGERRAWWAALELARLAPDRDSLVLDQPAVARALRERTAAPFVLTGSSVTVRAATFTLRGAELAAIVRDGIRGLRPGMDAVVEFPEFPPDRQLRGVLAGIETDLPGDALPRGDVGVGVIVRRTGLAPLRITVPCRVTIAARLVVARRVLPAGATLRAGDLQVVERETVPADAVADTGFLAGRRLARPLAAGEPVRESHLERPLLVRRGDRLLLSVGDGGVVVETPLQALGPGRENEIIDCLNPLTGLRLRARLTGQGTAVPEDNP